MNFRMNKLEECAPFLRIGSFAKTFAVRVNFAKHIRKGTSFYR